MPLVNFCALLPDGGSLFLGVVDTSGSSKTADYLFDLVREQAETVRRVPHMRMCTLQHRLLAQTSFALC